MNKIIRKNKYLQVGINWSKKNTYIYGFPFSIFVFLFLYAFVNTEIKEHFVYGQVTQGVVTDVKSYSSTSAGSSVWTFSIKPIEIYPNVILESSETRGYKNVDYVNIGDTLTIKIRTETQATIINIKGEEINSIDSFWETFFMGLPILILFFVGCIPYYVLFKDLLKKKD